jgi:hypothetical protein
MNRYLLCICTILLVANLSYGQRNRYPKEGEFPLKPGLIINTNFFSLFEPEAGPTLGLEYRINLHLAVALDATALAYTMPEWYYHDGRHTGFRLQPQVKLYLPGKRHSYQMYVSLMGTYKSVKYNTKTDGYDYYDGNVYVYHDPVEYREHKEVVAGSANFGVQKILDKEQHFMMEFFAGVGFRYKTRSGAPSLPGSENDYNYDEYDGLADGFLPHATAGIKFCYRF